MHRLPIAKPEKLSTSSRENGEGNNFLNSERDKRGAPKVSSLRVGAIANKRLYLATCYV